MAHNEGWTPLNTREEEEPPLTPAEVTEAWERAVGLALTVLDSLDPHGQREPLVFEARGELRTALREHKRTHDEEA